MLKRRGRIKKAAPRLAAGTCSKSSVASAQSNVAGDRQKQDASFVEDKWKPGFVIDSFHDVSQRAALSCFFSITMPL
jgi:hypothetical protein